MNEQLQKFIEWLPQNIEEFKDKSADEIAQILNQLSQSEEGKQQLNQLMEQFNSSVAQFRAGGKFASFIKRFGNGGGILFAEDGTKYNRAAARKQKAGLWSDVTDDMGTYQVRNGGDQNVLAKKMKAMNVTGYSVDDFDMDANQTFDRDLYRKRKLFARQQNPAWDRRQIKAWALSNRPMTTTQVANTQPVETPVAPTVAPVIEETEEIISPQSSAHTDAATIPGTSVSTSETSVVPTTGTPANTVEPSTEQVVEASPQTDQRVLDGFNNLRAQLANTSSQIQDRFERKKQSSTPRSMADSYREDLTSKTPDTYGKVPLRTVKPWDARTMTSPGAFITDVTNTDAYNAKKQDIDRQGRAEYEYYDLAKYIVSKLSQNGSWYVKSPEHKQYIFETLARHGLRDIRYFKDAGLNAEISKIVKQSNYSHL